MRSRTGFFALLAAVGSGLAACGQDTTAPTTPVTALVSVVPPGGATGVDPSAPIVIQFDHAMMTEMEMYASLHEGDVTGAVVVCAVSWSSDHSKLTLTPAAPLKAATRYTLHGGGGMKDANGDAIDMTAHGPHMGGRWATGQMMTGGMMGGGGPMSGKEMGPGWMGSNGMYGMVFSFTTT